MISLFSRSSRARSSSRVRRARPRLETLEQRTVPTSVCGSSAPLMLNLYAVQTTPQQIDIKGAIYDAPSGNNDTVLLRGGSGLNASCQVNPDGTFDFPVQGENLSQLGLISANAINNASLEQSSQMNFQQVGDAPVITNFQAAHGYGTTWTFSGTVQSQTPGQTMVQLGNLQSLQNVSVPCDQNGNFTYTITLTNTNADLGLATAIATDANGQVSEEALYYVYIAYES
jgi:hypothetical protein